jgi:hypothetical protein
MFLGLGLYSLFYTPGVLSRIIVVLFSAFGVLAVYKLIIGESIARPTSA